MDVSDISDAYFGERMSNFHNQLVGDHTPPSEREWARQEAWRSAASEMLDEIHLMLRTLLQRSAP